MFVAIILRVVIPKGGPIAVARILHSLVSQVHEEKETCVEGRRWIYRSEWVSSEGVYDLYMEGL